MTKREKRMVSLERSYRHERAGAGALALLTGVSVLGVIISYYYVSFHGSTHLLPHYEYLRKSIFFFMVWFFLAYRAQTKLWMIEHLKHHKDENNSEQDASADARASRG